MNMYREIWLGTFHAGLYLGLWQISRMEVFAKIVNSLAVNCFRNKFDRNLIILKV